MYNKGLLTGILAILFGVSLFYSWWVGRDRDQLKDKNAEYLTIITVNKVLIDSLQTGIKVMEGDIVKLKESAMKLRGNQGEIQQTYRKVYEKIYSSNDTAQLGITYQLLAEHKRQPIKRD